MSFWINGIIQPDTPQAPPFISPSDRGFTLGDGVFTTLRSDSGTPQNLDKHLMRLRRHAAVLGVRVPYSDTDITKAVEQCLTHDGFLAPSAVIRITLSRGVAKRGLLPPAEKDQNPIMVIQASALDTSAFESPLKTIISRTIRRNEGSALSLIKSLNYGDAILARMEAAEQDCDEAIMLNNKGAVTCATIGTLIMRTQDGRLVTPPLHDGVMDGITRGELIANGTLIEASLTEEDLHRAKALYIANSLMGMRPLILAKAA